MPSNVFQNQNKTSFIYLYLLCQEFDYSSVSADFGIL